MDNDVVTVMWGEFGRTPQDQQQRAAATTGRRSCRAMVAGGGLKMGQAIGTTTRPRRTPEGSAATRAPQVLSTLYRAIGIDPAQTFPNGSGRPMYILDDREPVRELL